METPLRPPYAFHATPSEYRLHRDDSESVTVIDRRTGAIRYEPGLPKASAEKCWGTLGISHFPSSNYLILIQDAAFVGRLKDACIFQVTEIACKPFVESAKDEVLVTMFHDLVSTKCFYFSYDYDLANSLSRQLEYSEEQKDLVSWQRSNYIYFWNNYLTEDFMKVSAHDAIVPVINGFVRIETVVIDGKSYDYGIISRRDHRRTGTRFNTRGLNEKGHAVNFVETEQLLAHWDHGKYCVSSFVQVRGSIPLLWEQRPNLKYMPRPKIFNNPDKNADSAQQHMKELEDYYGEVFMVNLIDMKGSQKMMGTAFTDLFNLIKSSTLHYTWFDFHHECRGMKYENLSKLLDKLKQFIASSGWTEAIIDEQGSFLEAVPQSKQHGAARTNCMDCLDRTNVVQSVIARNVLLSQLFKLNGRPAITGQAFQVLPGNLEQCFRNCWVDNADALSLLYTGTPAQKTDFTRLGKRTLVGALNDGKYSIQRYVINNFIDGYTQNSYDVFLGKFSARRAEVMFASKYTALYKFLGVLLVLLCVSHFVGGSVSGGFGYYVVFLVSLATFLKLLTIKGTLLVSKSIIK